MDEKLIRRIINNEKRLKKIFSGTFACDEFLPQHERFFAIINTASRSQVEPGHWTCIYKINASNAIYFDSLAFPMIWHDKIYSNVKRINVAKLVTSHKRVQGYASNVCGHMVIMFMYYITLGYSFNEFLSFFKNNDYVYNDKLACDFIKSRYPYAARVCT